MRQGLMFALVLSGCSFSRGDGAASPDAGDQPAAVGPCHVAPGLEADLRLCLEFEDQIPMEVARDASRFRLDATATGIRAARRTLTGGSEQAAAFAPGSRLEIGEVPELDLQQGMTVEMFVALDPIAPGLRYWMFDSGGQYFMNYGEDREVRCGINQDKAIDSGTDAVPIRITDAGWHHVACTYDRDELRVFVDGSLADCRDDDKVMAPEPGGTAIGSRVGSTLASEQFAGAIDNVHVFARALTPEEICTAAGQTSCRLTCPPKDGGGPGPGPGGD
jgi:hypothetical protein